MLAPFSTGGTCNLADIVIVLFSACIVLILGTRTRILRPVKLIINGLLSSPHATFELVRLPYLGGKL